MHSSLIIESIKNNSIFYRKLAIKLNELDDIKILLRDSFNKSLMIVLMKVFPAIKDLLNAHSSNAPKSILIRLTIKTQS